MPAHLNEISPPAARGTFPGVAYQLGNMLAAGNATIQAGLAAAFGDDYALALALVAGVGAAALGLLSLLGTEARTASMDGSEGAPRSRDGGEVATKRVTLDRAT